MIIYYSPNDKYLPLFPKKQQVLFIILINHLGYTKPRVPDNYYLWYKIVLKKK